MLLLLSVMAWDDCWADEMGQGGMLDGVMAEMGQGGMHDGWGEMG